MPKLVAGPRQNSRPRCQAFQAIAVKRAYARKIYVEFVAARVDVANLRMHQAVQGCALDQHAAADAGAHRHIHQVSRIAACTPAMFGKRRRVNVGVEADGAGKFPRQHGGNIGIAPANFRRIANEAIVGRTPIQNDGAEASHAHCARHEIAASLKKLANPCERGDRIHRGEARLRVNRAALIADGADEFCAAGLDGTEQASLAEHQVLGISVRWSIAYSSGYNGSPQT